MKWLLLVLLFACSAQAANHFVRQGATGDGSGSDWTNACTDFTYTTGSCDENNLTRGDTYYVADGSYSSAQFDTPTSGTSVIAIKKCSAGDHGTETGYVSTYCDGQAIFGDISVGPTSVGPAASHYWVFDGAYRNESSWNTASAYGFKASTIWSGGDGTCSQNVTVQYMELSPGDDTTRPIFLRFTGCDNWTFSRLYLHDSGEVNIAGGDTFLFEKMYWFETYGKECLRGQNQASNMVIRYNVFHDCCRDDNAPGEGCTAEVGVFANQGSEPDFEGFRAYGNIVRKTISQSKSDASIFAQASDCLVYNNTVYDNSTNQAADLECTLGGISQSRNNIVYLPNGITAGFSAGTSDNNSTYTSSPPFVNVATGDFHLTGALAGVSLSSPYNQDMDGATRGSDGTFDRGAFEYDDGGLQAPQNFRLISIVWWLIGLGALLGGTGFMRKEPAWQ